MASVHHNLIVLIKNKGEHWWVESQKRFYFSIENHRKSRRRTVVKIKWQISKASIYPTLWRPSATFCFHFPSRPYRLVAAIIERKRKFRFHVIKLAEPKTKILKVSNEIEKRKLWLTHRAEFPLFQAMFPQSHTAAKRGAKQSDWVNVLRIYCPHKSTVVGRHWVYRFFWDFCLDFSFYFVSP